MYKLRLRKNNDFTQDSEWLKLYSVSPTPATPTTTNNSTNTGTQMEYETVNFVIWYIAVCSSLLVFQLIGTSARGLCLKN